MVENPKIPGIQPMYKKKLFTNTVGTSFILENQCLFVQKDQNICLQLPISFSILEKLDISSIVQEFN